MATSQNQLQAPATDRLRAVHTRLEERCRATVSPREFFAEFLAEAATALEADGGAVWLADEQALHCAAHHQWTEHDVESLAGQVRAVAAEGLGQTVEVGVAVNKSAGGKTTARRVLLYPIRLGTSACGVVGLGLAADTSRETQGIVQRALVSLCDRAADYCFRRRAARGDANAAPAQFALEVHASLDLHRTAAAIANEARRLLDADRVGVAVRRQGGMEALAVSGQDHLERRSNLVRRLEGLAAATAAAGQPILAPAGNQTWAPQVEAAVEAYLDEGHARRLIALPLVAQTAGHEIVGVLTVEWIAGGSQTDASDSQHAKPSPPSPHWNRKGGKAPEKQAAGLTPAATSAELPPLLAALAPHAARALANSLRHGDLPLVGRFAAAAASLFSFRRARKKMVVLGVVAAIAAALMLVPREFTIEARGTLQPVLRRDVFAAVDGTVEKVYVEHGARVRAGDPLFELRSTDLDVAEADLIKQINETEQEFSNAQRLYNDGRSLAPAELTRLVGQMATLEQRRESLRRQAALLAEKRTKLRIVSPLAGQVTTWNVAELLAERPVRQGQALLGLVDPEGEWEIEIRLPEDRFGHVAEAHGDGTKPAAVTFMPATDPGREYSGTISETRLTAEPRGEEGNVVLAKAAIDKRQLAHLHPGADVRVRVHCGTRSLGYVMFHDVWSFVQANVLFRF